MEVDWNFQLNQTATNDFSFDGSFIFKFEFLTIVCLPSYNLKNYGK